MRRCAGIPRPAAARETTEKRRADRTGSDAPRRAAQTAFGHQVTRPTSPPPPSKNLAKAGPNGLEPILGATHSLFLL